MRAFSYGVHTISGRGSHSSIKPFSCVVCPTNYKEGEVKVVRPFHIGLCENEGHARKYPFSFMSHPHKFQKDASFW